MMNNESPLPAGFYRSLAMSMLIGCGVSACRGSGGEDPQLHFQGVIKTWEPDGATTTPPYVTSNRAILHGDSVFGVSGERFFSSPWPDVPAS